MRLDTGVRFSIRRPPSRPPSREPSKLQAAGCPAPGPGDRCHQASCLRNVARQRPDSDTMEPAPSLRSQGPSSLQSFFGPVTHSSIKHCHSRCVLDSGYSGKNLSTVGSFKIAAAQTFLTVNTSLILSVMI